MEAALFFLDCLLLALLLWLFVRAESPKGRGHLGFFAYEERREAPLPGAKSTAAVKSQTPQPPLHGR
jgi:hypothetical protein